MIFNALDKYELEQYEYGFIIEPTDASSDTCKVYIPKLTPFMNNAKPQTYEKTFNKNIFVNSSTTVPITSNSIKISNYLTIKKFNDFKSRSFKGGERVICCIMNKDIRDIYLTNFI